MAEPLPPDDPGATVPSSDNDLFDSETVECDSSRLWEKRPYILGSLVGEGGMARVYEGRDTNLNRTVAVKIMRPDIAESPANRARFHYEARILAELEHPGVVPVYEAGVLPELGSYYAMKKLGGRTLRQMLDEYPLPDLFEADIRARLLGVFEKICNTVAYAHARAIVHRDLKPANIMVDAFDVVHVLDWGLSKKLTDKVEEHGVESTAQGVIRGTPSYMSPEQAAGLPDAVDRRSDVFALGIILYEILTGARPFEAGDTQGLLKQIRHVAPPPPRQIRPEADAELSAICMKALDKNPDKRYPSARELAEDIARHRAHLPTQAYPHGPGRRLRNWIHRHPVASASLASAAAVLLVVGMVAWNRYENRQLRRAMDKAHRKELARLQQAREERLVHRTTTRIHEQIERLRAFDAELGTLRETWKTLPPDGESERKSLRRTLGMLQALRDELAVDARDLSIILVTYIATLRKEKVQDVDPRLLASLRLLRMEEIDDFIRHGDDWQALYNILEYLHRGEVYGVSKAERGQLEDRRKEVEARLRSEYGQDLEIPDFDAYKREATDRGLQPSDLFDEEVDLE